MKHILLALFLILTPITAMADYDEPKFVVEETARDIEIRRYEPNMLAEVTVDGTRDEAGNKAFRILFKYIQGANITQQEIAMTAPVTTVPSAVTGQEIPMTAPVTQIPNADKDEWVVAFYMPPTMTAANTPQPKDERITIREMPAQRKAAITFSGFWSDRNLAKHEAELRQYLETKGILYDEPAIFAAYNAPFMPWFLRRNEILFGLAD